MAEARRERDETQHGISVTDISQTSTLNNNPHSRDSHEKYSSDSTATNSSDEFDWDAADGDEQSIHQQKKAKRGRRVWLGFMKLARPLRTTIIAVLGAGILIAPLIVVHFEFRDSPARWHVFTWSLWLSIVWAAGSVTSLIIDTLPALILSFIFAVAGKAPEHLKTKLELFMAVSFWLKLALDISWAWIALSVIRAIVVPPGSYWVYVNRVMQALFSAGIILLVEKLFLQFVAIRFHEEALADRLAENHVALKALDRLSNVTAMGRYKGFKRKHKAGNASRNASVELLGTGTGTNSPISRPGTPDAGHALHSKADHPLSEKEKAKKKRKKAVSTMLGDAVAAVALKDSKFNKRGEIGSLHSARRLARTLFENLATVDPGRKELTVEDFHPFFKTEEDAKAAFKIFDKDGNGDISKKEMREAVQRIYRERKALTASLKDMSNVVQKLDGVLLAVALIIILFVCLLIFNRSNTIASLVPMATIILGFSFIFGNSAKTLFESLIFIFSTHVYDVGDLVMIDDQALFVKEFGLFSTTFRRVDGQEIIAPNALLASVKLIHNVRRSGSMWETTDLQVGYDTPLEVLEKLRQRLKQYVAANSREWGGGCEINIDKMEYQNAIRESFPHSNRANWQDWGGRWTRRNAFMKNMKAELEALEIQYSLPLQPVTFHSHSQPPPWYGRNEQLGNAGYMRSDGNRGGSLGMPGLGHGPSLRMGSL
ncbi:transporter, small conductance mechanosensitive ion channel (MscS) family protein [Ceratobasidium sp. AG-Ba]|nr:transporter, small conductance mechanosensitive ion channel (MscS) family protein [Ceratobasidium sp. AG-Ba]